MQRRQVKKEARREKEKETKITDITAARDVLKEKKSSMKIYQG